MRPFYLKQQPTNSKSNLNENGDPNKILTELRKNNFGRNQSYFYAAQLIFYLDHYYHSDLICYW